MDSHRSGMPARADNAAQMRPDNVAQTPGRALAPHVRAAVQAVQPRSVPGLERTPTPHVQAAMEVHRGGSVAARRAPEPGVLATVGQARLSEPQGRALAPHVKVAVEAHHLKTGSTRVEGQGRTALQPKSSGPARLAPPPLHRPATLVGRALTIQRATKAKSKRMAFSAKTIEEMPLEKGEHRRHIIPQNLLIAAIDTYFQHGGKDLDATALEKGCKMIISASHLDLSVPEGRTQQIQVIKRAVNDNLKNLFPGHGGENTAIGFLARQMGAILQKIQNFREEGDDPADILEWGVEAVNDADVYFGFAKGHAQEVKEATAYLKAATDLGDFVDKLTEVYHNLQLDPLKETDPEFSKNINEIYNQLVSIKAFGDGDLLGTLYQFMILERRV